MESSVCYSGVAKVCRLVGSAKGALLTSIELFGFFCRAGGVSCGKDLKKKPERVGVV